MLSHDLLEGSYLRCGLATDIMLLDGYPTGYNSFKARLHRWIRGDWQLVQWLGSSIINKRGEKKENPLSIFIKIQNFRQFSKKFIGANSSNINGLCKYF